MERQWKVIEGFDGKYEVSNYGEIKSKYGKGKILKSGLDTGGYYSLILSKNGKTKRHLVHRLVAQAFIPNPENKKVVDHINRIKHDNRVENLRWASQFENQHNTGMQKNNTTGYKNIFKTKWGYDVQINRNKLRYRKHCKSEEEAIAIRNLIKSMFGEVIN